MPLTLVNPMNEAVVKASAPPPRLGSLAGKKIALLDISKPGGSFFLDRLEKIFRERYQVGEDLKMGFTVTDVIPGGMGVIYVVEFRSGTSSITLAPAPTTDHAPTVRSGITLAPIPTNAPSPTRTAPPKWAPGAT